MNKVNHPFWVIVNKEISDHVKSWRFIILIGIIALTCMGSLYTALTNIGEAIKPNDPDGSFLFLKLFTVSDGTLPSFVLFINFLGPLLGIALGFDAVNSEQNKGTLSRMLSQPIHRDCIINAKFVAALIVIGIMLFVLGFLVMGCGLIAIGIPPTAEEFWRIVFFIITSIFYVAFWLNLAILFSLRFRQAATSALASVAVWLPVKGDRRKEKANTSRSCAPKGERFFIGCDGAADVIPHRVSEYRYSLRQISARDL